jgi:hypothetical protein
MVVSAQSAVSFAMNSITGMVVGARFAKLQEMKSTTGPKIVSQSVFIVESQELLNTISRRTVRHAPAAD